MTDIVTYPGPGFYPEMLADVINASWGNGLEKQTAFETKIASATSGWLEILSAPTIAAVEVGVPSVSAPATTETVTDAVALFDTKYGELLATLELKFSNFRALYFPDDSTAYASAEAWLTTELDNPDRVLPEALADMIWEEDRSRILADTQRASEETLSIWAARGYPLPPGAAVSAVMKVTQTGQNELAKSSRNVAIKTFEMAYEKIKFCVDKAVAMRQIAMSSALDYIKSLAVAPAQATQLMDAGYGAEVKLRQAAAAYYSASTDAAKLSYAAAEYNARAVQGAAEKNQASELALLDARLKALLAEAQALAQMATSLFNNIHASTSVSASDSVSTSI